MVGWFHRLARCPLWLLHRMGACAGVLAFLGSRRYRTRLRQHVAWAGFGPAVVRESVVESGKMLFELPHLWARPGGAPLGDAVQWEGLDLIEAAHRQGRGLVLLTPHMGCFEVTAQAYAERFHTLHPITVLYSPARKPWLRQLVDEARAKPGLATAPATLAGVRQMIRALRRGESVGLLPDQVPPEGLGEWADFFGRPAYTMTLASRLVGQTGAALLLIWAERLPAGRGYRVRVSEAPEPLCDETGQLKAESTLLVNRAMEALIRQKPGQYLWAYHRYKAPRALDT